MTTRPYWYGLVSTDVPLISNLSVLNNIALIRQYHRSLPREKAEAEVMAHLDMLGLTSIANKRNPSLSEEERFCAMVLRAAMMESGAILIDRPFKMMPDLKNSRFFSDVIFRLDDLLQECTIFDYIWNQERFKEEAVDAY